MLITCFDVFFPGGFIVRYVANQSTNHVLSSRRSHGLQRAVSLRMSLPSEVRHSASIMQSVPTWQVYARQFIYGPCRACAVASYCNQKTSQFLVCVFKCVQCLSPLYKTCKRVCPSSRTPRSIKSCSVTGSCLASVLRPLRGQYLL